MRIAVCIKQVPVIASMKFDPTTRTLTREGVASEVSSFDIRALLKAIDLPFSLLPVLLKSLFQLLICRRLGGFFAGFQRLFFRIEHVAKGLVEGVVQGFFGHICLPFGG